MSLSRAEQMTPEVAALLSLAMWPDPERIQAALARYASDPALQVWVWTLDGWPVSVAGLRRDGDSAEVLHLGTAVEVRNKGAGRSLLLGLLTELQLRELTAETDDGAVGFYQRCGFAGRVASSVGDRIRYHCTLSPT